MIHDNNFAMDIRVRENRAMRVAGQKRAVLPVKTGIHKK